MTEVPPVIIVGAGRSGTNLLRDIICSFDAFGTWPCDEINYTWRHGNRDAPTDELHTDDARPDVKRFIRRAFEKQEKRQGGGTVVEKTCATSLRVAFVHEVFPDARFVFIMRDGRDVVASAMERWTAPLDLRYLARKARFVPPVDLPHYAMRYLGTRLSRLGSAEHRLGTWGPRFAGMSELIVDAPLAEVCAQQWRRCVEATEQQLDCVSIDQIHRIRYEDLVREPKDQLKRLAGFLDASQPSKDDLAVVKTGGVGRWRTTLSERDQSVVNCTIGDALASRGYSDQ